ncbi:MAG: hypothetical protein ACR2G5_00385 [Pyrinomonadaceae bacterium]
MQTAQSVLASSCSVFEDSAGGVCFRGSVLGDQRATAFDGAKLDLLRAGADTFFPRFGRFDGQSFGWFKPDIPFDFGWVFEQAAVQTRDGEWWLGSGAGLYRFPASDNFARIKTARPLAIYTNEGRTGSQSGVAAVLRLWRQHLGLGVRPRPLGPCEPHLEQASECAGPAFAQGQSSAFVRRTPRE